MDRHRRRGAEAARGAYSPDRRRLLQWAGLGLAAAAWPKRLFAADAASPMMLQLSDYMSRAGDRPLPEEVLEGAKQHILDTFASMISGAELAPGRAALAFARQFGSDKTATIVASRMTAAPPEAALVNAMLAQADETDDSNEFSQSHPGCAVVPAALAAGERFGIDGTRFLRAVVLGYDIGPRMTISFGAVKFRNTSHKSTHAIAGIFGSAAAAGCAARLDAQQMRWLLDYTAQQSSGIGAWTRDLEHIEKSFVFGGMAARSGVTSALLVQAGFNGLDDIFSGADNYFQAYAPDANPQELVRELGERYEITRTNIKKWTVGSPIQAPLDALANLMQRRPFKADEVQGVVVRLSHTQSRTVNNRDMPDICLQHMVAVMLLDQTASFRAAHDKPRMTDPAVLRQRAKVQLVPSDELEREEPGRHAIVEVTLDDGTVLAERVNDVRGTHENPMTREEVVRKSRDLVEPAIGKGRCTRLVDAVFALEKLKDVRALRGLLQAG